MGAGMVEWMVQVWNGFKSNAEAIGVVVAILVAIGGLGAWLLVSLGPAKTTVPEGRQAMEPEVPEAKPAVEEVQSDVPQVRGGNGGNASVGGNGVAIGGRGGRGGLAGTGGDGGGGQVAGDGMAMGGDGGDAGTPSRPALGASSPMERLNELGLNSWPDTGRDEYGFLVVGRGGSGGDTAATVNVGGEEYPLLPLTMLLRLWAPDVLDAADATRPAGPQEFWNAVTRIDPSVAVAAERHIRESLAAIDAGASPPDPYERPVD